MTKCCSVCGEEKPLDQFTKDRRRKSGIAGKCKPCKQGQDWRNPTSTRSRPRRDWETPEHKFLSLGAGVQSTTVLLLSEEGVLPRLDAAIFADTGWEPQEVYDHLERLKNLVTIPICIVNNGSLKEDVYANQFIEMPVFSIGEKRPRMMRRQCTNTYKIRPIRTKVKELTGGPPAHVEQWIGISLDESTRMKDSDVQWIRNVYPLVDMRWTRTDCADYLREHGLSVPKSACVTCPFRSDRGWLRMRDTDPVSWSEAVRADEFIREQGYFLHRKCIPLADLEDTGQESLFDMECEGYCGV